MINILTLDLYTSLNHFTKLKLNVAHRSIVMKNVFDRQKWLISILRLQLENRHKCNVVDKRYSALCTLLFLSIMPFRMPDKLVLRNFCSCFWKKKLEHVVLDWSQTILQSFCGAVIIAPKRWFHCLQLNVGVCNSWKHNFVFVEISLKITISSLLFDCPVFELYCLWIVLL